MGILRMLRPGQLRAIKNLCDICDIKGKKIIEIGGDLKHELANALIGSGALHITSVNKNTAINTFDVNENLSTVNLDATKLTSYFHDNTFDVAFGVALLEHLSNLALMLDQVYSVLKPGGIALLHGDCIWTSAKGHHLWVNGNQKAYRFNNNELNPIPDFYHLILRFDEMIKYLIEEENVVAEDAKKIADWVYRSKNLSRTSYSDFRSIFESCKFEIIKVTEIFGNRPNAMVLKKLNDCQWGQRENFGVRGLEFIVRKSYA